MQCNVFHLISSQVLYSMTFILQNMKPLLEVLIFTFEVKYNQLKSAILDIQCISSVPVT